MKTVYTSQEQITHLWANAAQPHARCANASYSTSTINDGTTLSTLLSYSTPIAYRVQSIDPSVPPMFVICRANGWSMTTQKHIRTARDAVPHIYRGTTAFTAVFPNAYGSDYPWTGHSVPTYTSDMMRELLVKAAGARSPLRKATSTEEALRLGTDYNDMLAWVNAHTPQWASCTPALIDIDAIMGMDRKAALAQQRANRKALDAARVQHLKDERALLESNIAVWRDHGTEESRNYNRVIQHDTPIRLSKDGTRVETMRSAEIPLAHAQQLWRVLQWDTLAKVTLALKRSKLGNHTIDEVKPNRDLIVGCHIITFAEMQGLAAKHPDLFPTTTTTTESE